MPARAHAAALAQAVEAAVSNSPEICQAHLELPTSGFARQWQLIGRAAVTVEQAAENTRLGKGPRRARPGIEPVIPFSSPTLWRKVKTREFPAPVRLSAGVTAWAWQDVRAWMAARAIVAVGAK